MSDEIQRIIQRDIDSLPVLPEERWVPTSRASAVAPERGAGRSARLGSRAVRLAVTVLSIAAIITGAVVIGLALNARRGGIASPPPDTQGGIASPPLDTQDGFRYGLIVQQAGPVIRSEEDPNPIARLYAEPTHRGLHEFAVQHDVSPEGRRVLYWIYGAGPPGSLSPKTLALFDGADSSTRELVRLTREGATGAVWSTDGTGALIGVWWNDGFASVPALARLWTLDLGSGDVSEVGPIFGPSDGREPSASGSPVPTDANIHVRPLWWDRAADRIIAVVSRRNVNYASEIVIIDRGVLRSYPLEGRFLGHTISISPDGTRLAGARMRDFAVVVWSADDYGKRNEIVPHAGERILSVWWRPRTDQVFFMRDNALTDDPAKWSRLEVWRPGVDSARIVDPTPGFGLIFRFDGSAYLMRPETSSPISSEWDVVDPDSGQVIGHISDARVAGTLLLPAQAGEPTGRPPSR